MIVVGQRCYPVMLGYDLIRSHLCIAWNQSGFYGMSGFCFTLLSWNSWNGVKEDKLATYPYLFVQLLFEKDKQICPYYIHLFSRSAIQFCYHMQYVYRCRSLETKNRE